VYLFTLATMVFVLQLIVNTTRKSQMADFARSPAGTRAVNGKIRKSWQLPTSCQPGLPSSKAACTKYLRVIGRVHIQYIMYNQYIMYMV